MGHIEDDYIDVIREGNRIYLTIKIELANDAPILDKHLEYLDSLKARFA